VKRTIRNVEKRTARGSTAAAAGAVAILLGGSADALAGDAGAATGGKGSVSVVTLAGGPGGDAVALRLASKLASPYAAASHADSLLFLGAVGPAAVRSALMEAALKHKDRDTDFVARIRGAAQRAHADRALVVHTEKGKKNVVHVWMIDAKGSGPAEVEEDVHPASGSTEDETSAAWTAVEGSFPAAAEASSSPASSASAASPSSPSATATTPGAGAGASGSIGAGANGSARSGAPPTSAPSSPAEATSLAAAPADGVPPTTSSRDRSRAHALASLGLDVLGGSRHFSYVDRLTGTLRPYDLSSAPALEVSGDVYPLARTHVPVLAGLGLQAQYSHAFGLSSQDSSGTSVSTTWQAFEVGLRDRIALGDSVLLGIGGGYGDTSFSFSGAVTPIEQLPSVDYQYLRGGIDGRYALGAFSVRGAFGYRGVLSTGDFGKLFPRETVGGIDAGLGLAWMMAPGMELSLDASYVRFYYSLLPQPGDSYVAGGALDEMAALSLGFTYLL
jgi:hypothetical protein